MLLSKARLNMLQTILGTWISSQNFFECVEKEFNQQKNFWKKKNRGQFCSFGFNKCVTALNLLYFHMIFNVHLIHPARLLNNKGQRAFKQLIFMWKTINTTSWKHLSYFVLKLWLSALICPYVKESVLIALNLKKDYTLRMENQSSISKQ